MTQDALTEANSITSQIQARQLLLSKHLSVVKQHMPELTANQQSQITTLLQNIHTPEIAALQTQFTNLTADYTKP